MVTPSRTRLLRVRGWLEAQETMRLAALVGIAVFLADWASKSWVLTSSRDTLDALLLMRAYNHAFVFSAGADSVTFEFVIGARLLALCALAVLFGRWVVCDRRSAAGFGLILGGGFGNTADLAFRGAVVDFINAGPLTIHWAGQLLDLHFVFNPADFAILLGIALLAPRIRVCALGVQRRIGEWEMRWLRDRGLRP